MHVFDLGLQLAAVTTGDLPSEDDGDLVRSAMVRHGVEQAFAEGVKGCPSVDDQIVGEGVGHLL